MANGADDEVLNLKPTFGTRVFVNEPGYIAIAQRDDATDDVVMLSPQQAPLVAEALCRLADRSDEWGWSQLAGTARAAQARSTHAAPDLVIVFEDECFLAACKDEAAALELMEKRAEHCNAKGATLSAFTYRPTDDWHLRRDAADDDGEVDAS